MKNQSDLFNAQEGSSERRGRPAGLVSASWDDTAETMWNEVTRSLEAGMTKKAAYAEQAKKLGRTVSAIENKFRKMTRAKKDGGTGNRELPNKPKKKGTLTLVRYYAKTDGGLETPLGTGTSMDTLLAVINTIDNDSGIAR